MYSPKKGFQGHFPLKLIIVCVHGCGFPILDYILIINAKRYEIIWFKIIRNGIDIRIVNDIKNCIKLFNQ